MPRRPPSRPRPNVRSPRGRRCVSGGRGGGPERGRRGRVPSRREVATGRVGGGRPLGRRRNRKRGARVFRGIGPRRDRRMRKTRQTSVRPGVRGRGGGPERGRRGRVRRGGKHDGRRRGSASSAATDRNAGLGAFRGIRPSTGPADAVDEGERGRSPPAIATGGGPFRDGPFSDGRFGSMRKGRPPPRGGRRLGSDAPSRRGAPPPSPTARGAATSSSRRRPRAETTAEAGRESIGSRDSGRSPFATIFRFAVPGAARNSTLGGRAICPLGGTTSSRAG